ncbi:MAG: ketoacyl-ACP synthase III [Ignavibacterium sp.]
MQNAKIIGSGSYVPERVIPNKYFNEIFGEDVDTWLVENLNIKERHWCNEEQSTSDLCVEAAKKAMKNAQIKTKDIDLIIVATDTPDYISPSTASVVQHKLNAKNAGTFDINSACAGFVTAITVGGNFLRADNDINYVLVIGAYAMSKYLNLQDKKTANLFADGAGAVILGKTNKMKEGYIISNFHTEGQYHDWMGIYAGGTKYPISFDALEKKEHLLKFVNKFPKELNPIVWTKMIKKICKRSNILPKDINHYFFTQLNINSIYETMDNLKIERNRAHTIMDKYAYTGSACIPMALDDANKLGKIKKGDLVLFMGSGGGLAFAVSIWKI